MKKIIIFRCEVYPNICHWVWPSFKAMGIITIFIKNINFSKVNVLRKIYLINLYTIEQLWRIRTLCDVKSLILPAG